MFKKILYKTAVMTAGIIESGIVAMIAAVVTGILLFCEYLDSLYVTSMIILVIVLACWLYLFAAVFLYRLGRALNLKLYICDILYLIGLILAAAFYFGRISILLIQQPDAAFEKLKIDSIGILIIAYAGIAVYLAQVFSRTQKRLSETGYYDSGGRNWEDVFKQVLKHPQMIFTLSVRSYAIAFVVILMASMEQHNFDSSVPITCGPFFSLCLLPVIILYHSACSLKLKTRICDAVYFIVFAVMELFLLPFVLNTYMIAKAVPFSRLSETSHLPVFGMSVIAIGGIYVYMAEICLRSRAILKSIGLKN
jgi:ABC-type multidrug transport system fused ATPase/permease subunit